MTDKIDLSSPEVKEAIETAVSEAIDGLKNKNSELLGEIKKLKKNSEIKPEDYNSLREEKEALETQLAEIGKASKIATTEFDKLKKQLESEIGFNTKLIVDNGLQSELVANGVTNPAHLKAAKALLSGQTAIKAEGESKIALLDGKPLGEAVKAWATGEEGKHFVAAKSNSGSGASGGASGAGDKAMPRTQFDALDSGSRMAFVKDGGQVIDG